MSHRYVSCQCFAGGFDVGMVQSGFELTHKVEMTGGFGMANCLANRHILGSDWTYQSTDPAAWADVRADVLVGNPPCSGWSVMSSAKFRGANSPALSCTWSFADYVERVQPQIAVFESVQQAFTMDAGLDTMRALRARVESRTSKSWTLYHILHNAYSVGGASQRKRYFWLISQVPFGVERPIVEIHPTLNDVIQDLTTLDNTWSAQPYRSPAHRWAEHLLSPSGTVDGHQWNSQTPLTRRILDLIHGTQWHPGDDIATVTRRYYYQHGKLPLSFANTEQKLIKSNFKMGYTTPTRWNGERHARVITGGALQLVIHPTLDRLITHREAARIMGFPDNWLIEPLQRQSNLAMTWGKGITTHCGRWIGDWMGRALDGSPGSHVGTEIGDREYAIDVTHDWTAKKSQKTTSLITKILRTSSTISNTAVMRDTRRHITLPKGTVMTENEINTEATEATEVTTSSTNAPSRKGRPRPSETIERDNAIYDLLDTPKTRATLVDETGIEPAKVFLSLHRLRNDGRIERNSSHGTHYWSRATKGQTAENAPAEPTTDGSPQVA